MKYEMKRVTISSESLPIIKKTIFPDWVTHVMGDYFEIGQFNKTEMYYTFPNGSVIQFIPSDDEARWHGLRQDIVYFDELYYIPRKVYDQADIRTNELVISSFNPIGPFWIQDVMEDARTWVDHSTYKDNQFLSGFIAEALEKRSKVDKNFYNVYVLGNFGSLEGLVFQEGEHWDIVDGSEFPADYKRQVLALDWGYSVDPTVIVEIGWQGGQVWLREKLHSRGLTNQDVGGYLRRNELVICDNAEPKSIAELRKMGIDARPSVKGRDSIANGIQLVKQFRVNIDKGSINMIKEFRNYKWKEDTQGEPTGVPIDAWNHTIDAVRYGMHELFAKRLEFTLY